jgi:Domain of unknown function (DUF4158)
MPLSIVPTLVKGGTFSGERESSDRRLKKEGKLKRHWELHELVESWTLLPHELALLDSKIGVSRLGFAVLLKFFEIAHKFPSSAQDVPPSVVSYIAQQVNVPAEKYFEIDWNGRSMMRHRGEIRAWIGFRKATGNDRQEIVKWLCKQILAQESELEHLKVLVEQRFLFLKIEPPTEGRTERLIRSAIHTYETDFFADIDGKLTPRSRVSIDTLLKTSHLEDEYSTQPSLFGYLNSEPGRASLESFLGEITKLEHLRKIGLPDDLFHNGVLQRFLNFSAICFFGQSFSTKTA